MTSLRQFKRREFLVMGGTVAVAALSGALPRILRAVPGPTQNHVIFRLSLRGRRGSKAAKLHNANMLFATAAAADLNRAHPGDQSRIVELTVDDARFNRLFPLSSDTVADLRGVTLGCIGDCDRDSHVTVDEVVTMVDRALGGAQESTCNRGDLNRDTKITVDEIVTAVNNALQGCS